MLPVDTLRPRRGPGPVLLPVFAASLAEGSSVSTRSAAGRGAPAARPGLAQSRAHTSAGQPCGGPRSVLHPQPASLGDPWWEWKDLMSTRWGAAQPLAGGQVEDEVMTAMALPSPRTHHDVRDQGGAAVREPTRGGSSGMPVFVSQSAATRLPPGVEAGDSGEENVLVTFQSLGEWGLHGFSC